MIPILPVTARRNAGERPAPKRRRARLVPALALWLAVAGPLQAEYLLSSGDTLRLRAMRWDALAATHQDWQGLTGDYTVSPDGWLSIPLVGALQVAGETPRDLAARIGEIIQRRVGTPEPPFVALEVTSHAPVYVLGAAASPGAYPFRPGLTVQQAVALAGGYAGQGAAASGNAAGEAVRLDGEVRLLTAQIAALEAQKARLLADLALLDGTGNEPAALSGLQGRLLEAIETGRRAKAESLHALKATLEVERESLVAQIRLREGQIAAAESELADVASLRERGLALNARVSAQTARATELEAQRLQLEVARLGVTQRINEAERALGTLRDDARAQRLAELGEVEREIAATTIRLTTARTLRDVALSRTDGAAAAPVAATRHHRVTRSRDGEAETLELAPTDPLMPGDTIEIVLEMPEG